MIPGQLNTEGTLSLLWELCETLIVYIVLSKFQ